MVLNTDRLSVDTCVQQIKALLSRPEFAETDASRALLQSMALHAHVRAALRAHEATREVDVSIEGNGGVIVLRGIVVNTTERDAAEKVAAGVPGVTGVDSQLRVMATSRLFTSSKN
jgi:BON domain